MLIILCAYKWRQCAGNIAGIMLVLIVCLHIAMKAPVWHLISRINLIGGSTGWHRYNLIDKAIRHFGEWMLLGCRDTADWGTGLEDITNQYVLEGVNGGFVTLVIFLIIIYEALSTTLRMSIQNRDGKSQILTWCLFTTIMGHSVAFFGVSYFGQIMMWWYMTLAIVGYLIEAKECNRQNVAVIQKVDGEKLRFRDAGCVFNYS